jgi:TolB-like protein
MVYEKQYDLPKAISEYGEYYQKNPLTLAGRRLKARIGILMRKQIAREVKAAVEREESLDVDRIPENTIAVLYFANLTGDKEFDVLGKGLADMIITDLSQVNALKVVERTRIQALVDELKLGDLGVIDKSTAPRAGRLLGARRIVNGGLAAPQANTFTIDALATNIVVGKTDAQADVTGMRNRFFLMEKELVFGILEGLNIEISQKEQDAIQKLPTESFLAFLAYSRGLDYEDRGMYGEAAGEYQKATEIDRGFSQASEKAQENQTRADASMTGSFSDMENITEPPPPPKVVGLSNSMRQEIIDQNISSGFLPSPDEGEQADDRTPSQQQTMTTVTVTVELE